MREDTRQIGGDHTFDEDTIFRGQVGGNATVGAGIHLTLQGQICATLT